MTKLEELILYVSEASLTDPDFGMTKLNKILFNGDFTAFGLLGKSITNEEYQKLPKGPTVRRLLPAIDKAAASGRLVVKTVKRGPYDQKRVVPLDEADLSHFTAEEISIVDESINAMRGMSAVHVSDLSHNFLGWQLVELYETIPYETLFMSMRPLTADESKFALGLP